MTIIYMKAQNLLPFNLSEPLSKRRLVRDAPFPAKPFYQTNPVPKTDSSAAAQKYAACRDSGTWPEPHHRHLPNGRQTHPGPLKDFTAPSSTCEPSRAPQPLAIGVPLYSYRKLGHVTHLLLTAMDALRPIGRALGARAALLLEARAPRRRRIGRCGRLERCDLHRRRWRKAPRGDAARGGGICCDWRRNQTPAPESEG